MYKYYFRPGYGSSKLLIEFFIGTESNSFISDLFAALSELNLEIIDVSELWMNDEILLNIHTEMGELMISKDI